MRVRLRHGLRWFLSDLRRYLKTVFLPSPLSGPTPIVDFVEAFGRDEFEMHFQPLVRLDGSLVGAEALLRWRHPRLGLISPDDFLALVDAHTRTRLDSLALSAAMQMLPDLRCRTGGRETYLGVNFAPVRLQEPHFAQWVLDQLARHRCDGYGLVVEITEAEAVNCWQSLARNVHRLAAHGVLVALDDFGTGHANFQNLERSGATIVKLDKSLVQRVTSVRGAAVADAVIALAKQLGFTVVAEGIEDEPTEQWLRSRPVSHLQGYRYGQAVPREVFLTQHRCDTEATGLPRWPQAIPVPEAVTSGPLR